MPFTTSKPTTGDTSPTTKPTDVAGDEWDQFMAAEGFHPSTQSESEKFDKFFECAQRTRDKSLLQDFLEAVRKFGAQLVAKRKE